MIQLTNTAACVMRDELKKARYSGKISLKEITNRLIKTEIPDWLQSEIIQMRSFRKYERLTCPVELAMEAAVNYKILKDLLSKSSQNESEN